MNKILSLCGLAKRAGKVIPGTDAVCEAMAKGKIHYCFVANDASAQTIDKLDKKCFFYHIKLNKDFNSLDIDQALGLSNSKVIGIADKGFADAIIKLCEEQNN